MKIFAAWCRDGGDKSELRQTRLQAHFEHVLANMEYYSVAGPLKDDRGQTTGSLLIVKSGTKYRARAFLESDPYALAGVWDEIKVHEFVGAAGEWVGGATWLK